MISKPTVIVHFQTADKLSQYVEMGPDRPPYTLRRICWRKPRPFFTPELDPMPTPIREYEYMGIELENKKKVILLYREIL